MAKFSLIPFNLETAPETVIESELNTNIDSIFVSFRIKKNLHLIELGNATPAKNRTLNLWEKTCFELFIKNESDEYVEFNFSPNFQWNCFYFKKPGSPLLELESMKMPILDILLSSEHFFLFAEIKKGYFPKGFFGNNEKLSCGISCVIQDQSKDNSYWALIHQDSRPNFHHFDSFKYKF